jgi:hypothetical protein
LACLGDDDFDLFGSILTNRDFLRAAGINTFAKRCDKFLNQFALLGRRLAGVISEVGLIVRRVSSRGVLQFVNECNTAAQVGAIFELALIEHECRGGNGANRQSELPAMFRHPPFPRQVSANHDRYHEDRDHHGQHC